MLKAFCEGKSTLFLELFEAKFGLFVILLDLAVVLAALVNDLQLCSLCVIFEAGFEMLHELSQLFFYIANVVLYVKIYS